MTAVHQFVPSYVTPSAIGTHTLEVAQLLRGMGLESTTYVGAARGVEADRHVRPYQSFRPDGQPTWLLYQLSIGHAMGDFLAERTEPLVVNYHNITPEEFLLPWEPLIVPELRLGRRNLDRLAARSDFAIADSRYNEDELRLAGYGPTTTVPVLVDYEQLAAEADRGLSAQLAERKREGGADWIFVGRLIPNKAQHRLVQALAVYRYLHDPKARLWLVGGAASHLYQRTMERLIAELGLGDAVTITGEVPQRQLVSYFQAADVFVSLSEHEGFGIPLVEAMWHGVPVVAASTSAVTDTVGDAGILLYERDGAPVTPGLVATAVHRVLDDGALRDALVRRGHERVEHFSLTRNRDLFRSAIEKVVGG